jgi:hypothetical protein
LRLRTARQRGLESEPRKQKRTSRSLIIHCSRGPRSLSLGGATASRFLPAPRSGRRRYFTASAKSSVRLFTNKVP